MNSSRTFPFLLTLLISTTGYSFAGPGDHRFEGNAKSGSIIAGKIDPVLRAEITSDRRAQKSSEVDVIVKTDREIGRPERGEMEKRGARISSVLGRIAVMRIPSDRIVKLARLKFVVYIEKAKKEFPK